MNKSGKIIAVCSSPQKQTKKENIKKGTLKANYGLMGDAHCSSKTHRQVSLLAQESIHKMNDLGLEVKPGDFAENMTTSGIQLTLVDIGTQVQVGESAILVISQIGKECHNRCAIYEQTGDCIMPREGIFAKVLKGGIVKIGDEIKVI